MSFIEEVKELIGKQESDILEYKTVLPPSRNIAQLICGFANAEGGYIILGVKENYDSTLSVVGLSQDFMANEIVHKAIDMLYPKPKVEYRYITHESKQLYAIKIEKAKETIMAENKKYIRKNCRTILLDEVQKHIYTNKSDKDIVELSQFLNDCKTKLTSSMVILIEHYQSILNLLDNYQQNNLEKNNQELKILKRILFSSCVDNFETYLSNLLYEIYLSNPNTLKSEEMIEVSTVLSCSDIQEFIILFANKKIQKLQKGSIKGFIKENKQISDLGIMNKNEDIEAIEKILQIRHLFSHKNGIIDEKFLRYYPDFKIGQEMILSIVEICEKLRYLINTSKKIDEAAIQKYNLAMSDL